MIRPDNRMRKSSWKDMVLLREVWERDVLIRLMRFPPINYKCELLLIEEGCDIHSKHTRRKAWLPFPILSHPGDGKYSLF